MRYLGFLMFFIVSFAHAVDIYGKHNLCLKNPQDSYMTGDATSAYPSCLKEYAVIHVPTELLDRTVSSDRIKSLETQLKGCQEVGVSQLSSCNQQSSFYQSTSLFGGAVSLQEAKHVYSLLFDLALAVLFAVVLRAVLVLF